MKNQNEQGNIRVTTYNNSTVRMTDCEFAGKRGKTCTTVTIEVWSGGHAEQCQLFCDLVHNMEMKLEDVKTLDDALAFAQLAKNLRTDSNTVRVHESSEKGVRVQPIGFEELHIGNDNYAGSIGYETFSLSDKLDLNNCPRWIDSQNNKSDYKKVYNYVKENMEALNAPEVTFHTAIKMISEATGVHGHYYCAMD